MKRRSRWTIFWFGTGTVILIIAALILFLPRPSTTEWYTSPPIDAKGTRLKLRVPTGYRLQENSINNANGRLRFERLIPEFFALTSFGGEVSVTVEKSDIPDSRANKPALTNDYTDMNESCVFCRGSRATGRTIYIPSSKYQIRLFYANDDLKVFEQNYTEIVNSLTVLP